MGLLPHRHCRNVDRSRGIPPTSVRHLSADSLPRAGVAGYFAASGWRESARISATEKVDGFALERLGEPGWTEAELDALNGSDRTKLQLSGKRLVGTTRTLRWIAVQLPAKTGASWSNLLSAHCRGGRECLYVGLTPSSIGGNVIPENSSETLLRTSRDIENGSHPQRAWRRDHARLAANVPNAIAIAPPANQVDASGAWAKLTPSKSARNAFGAPSWIPKPTT